MNSSDHTTTGAGGNSGEHNPHTPTTYKFRVDKLDLVSNMANLTGRALLLLAGRTPPERFQLFAKKGAELTEIGLDATVDLAEPGVERFVTLALDQTEGEVQGFASEHAQQTEVPAPRRDFTPLPEDAAFLNALGLRWETVSDGGIARVVVYGYPVPPGYNHTTVDLNVRIDPTYPDTQIDMVYVHPALVRTDGRAIRALAEDPFDDKVWQRWSRHRTAENPWRPGVDDLSTHLALVNHWFIRELAGA
ncbi:MAG TPA: multiubiquitin domain-containing protein [Azospirillum sp.]|nr:multiubiquitin domain-containing protein [Azospirillum sp.]